MLSKTILKLTKRFNVTKRTILLAVLVLVAANLLIWIARQSATTPDQISNSIATPSDASMVTIVHKGDTLPKNWLIKLVGEVPALTQLMAAPFWENTLICVRWPISPTTNTKPSPNKAFVVAPEFASWANLISSPSVAATLHAWNKQLKKLQNPKDIDPMSQSSLQRLTLEQKVLSGELSKPSAYVWRYPITLWAELVMLEKKNHPNRNDSEEVPSKLTFWFASALSANKAKSALKAWQHDELIKGLNLTVEKLNNDQSLKHWIFQKNYKNYADKLKNYPFWRDRQLCL